jgi:putative ABC transport system permease protein
MGLDWWQSLPSLAYASLVGVVLLLGFALPPLLNMVSVPPLKVLRRDLAPPNFSAAFRYGFALLALLAVAAWQAGDIKLGSIVLGGTLLLIALVSGLTWLLIRLLKRSLNADGSGNAVRQGLRALCARPLAVSLQLASLSVGVMALLLLTQVAGDLFDSWRRNIPPDAPNQFLINIQAKQQAPLAETFQAQQVKAPTFYPMIRARLVAINGVLADPKAWPDDNARRLIEREFNLSESRDLMAGNHLLAGQWFKPTAMNELSLEESIAKRLKVGMGDTLSFEVMGNKKTFTITSLRKVDWDSFRVNFFAMVPVGTYPGGAQSVITAIRTPDAKPAQSALAQAINQRFPNILSIDMGEIMSRVMSMVERVARALEFVLAFTLATGLLVLYTAIVATQDERRHDTAIWRVLGASRAHLRTAALTEFAALGALAGLMGAAAATGVGYAIATQVLNVSYQPNLWKPLLAVLLAALSVMAAGWLGVRRALDVSPMETLRHT